MENEPQDSPLTDNPTTPPIATPAPEGRQYGGNMGNSTQGSYHDQDRLENQQSSPGRGEFGPQGPGETHGGYGNQFRADDIYDGQLGQQPIDSGGYQGGRPENNTGSPEELPNDGQAHHPEGSTFGTEPGTPLDGTTVDPHYRNDNASPEGRSAGFSEDYGQTSLTNAGSNAPQPGQATLANQERNQTEDYIPSQPDGHAAPGTMYQPEPTPHGNAADTGGRNEPGPAGEPETAAPGSPSRSGYTGSDGEKSFQGNTGAGIGSQGGSYNDSNVPMNPDAGATSPNQGAYDRNQQPAPPADADSPDYGTAPRRNAGRDNDSDRD